jgi:hypothetical protein
MNWKETYTKIFLKQAGKSINEVSMKEHMPIWWQNTRKKDEGGLRLTDEGYRVLKDELEVQFYDIPYPPDFEFTTQSIIFLDKFITCPYYMDRRHLSVTDEKKALELHLFSGDVRKYGLTKAMKRQDKEN